MANYTLTTNEQEVGSNLSVTVGGRLLAWYSDADSSGATVHLKLQAISQGIAYTGTNKDYELTLDGTATGTVVWSYSPLPADTWIDVTEITQRVSFGSTISVSGKIWTYVYGDAWIAGNTVTLASQYTPPTGLTVSAPYNITPHGATFDVSVSSYGDPSSITGRYIEAAILGTSAYGSPYSIAVAFDVASSSITVNNSGSSGLIIQPNTQYYYGGYANNTQKFISTVSGQFVTAAEGPQVSISSKTTTSVTLDYVAPADGGYYSKTLAYSLDNGSTWTTFATITSGSAASGSFTISGLTQNSVYTVLTKATTTVGSTAGTTVTVDLRPEATLYGSVNGTTKRIDKLYGPVPVQYLRISGVSNQRSFNPAQFSGTYFSTYGPISLTVYPITLDVSTSGSNTIVSIGYNNGTSKTIFTYPTNNYNYAGSAWGWTSNNYPPVSGSISTYVYTDHYETKAIDKLYGSVNGVTERIF